MKIFCLCLKWLKMAPLHKKKVEGYEIAIFADIIASLYYPNMV